MDNKTITFKRSSNGLKELAIFLAQLVKEGVTYKVINNKEEFGVELTGGY